MSPWLWCGTYSYGGDRMVHGQDRPFCFRSSPGGASEHALQKDFFCMLLILFGSHKLQHHSRTEEDIIIFKRNPKRPPKTTKENTSDTCSSIDSFHKTSTHTRTACRRPMIMISWWLAVVRVDWQPPNDRPVTGRNVLWLNEHDWVEPASMSVASPKRLCTSQPVWPNKWNMMSPNTALNNPK